MSILKALGLTKEAIARLLAPSNQDRVPAVKEPKSRKFKGRKKWHIPKKTVDAVRAEPADKTLEELAHKYKVSTYWVWSVRKNKLRMNK